MMGPIVDEVCAYRMEHTLRFRGDLDAICRDLQKTGMKCQRLHCLRCKQVHFPMLKKKEPPEPYIPEAQ